MSRCLDEPLVTWGECVVGDASSPEGVVVALPHDADRLDVGLAIITRTHWGAERSPYPGEVTIRAAWARLFTLHEQWVWEWNKVLPEDPWDDPPAFWWPSEGTPSWIEDPHGDEVWIATWTT